MLNTNKIKLKIKMSVIVDCFENVDKTVNKTVKYELIEVKDIFDNHKMINVKTI